MDALTLLPYQTRVIAELAELAELDAKREALRGWTRNETFETLDADERTDQSLQLHHMDVYAYYLMRRIARFTGAPMP